MGHNNQKKIAAINDYTGFGRCSIAVELPVISALKVQCCPLPTSVLSNHTGFDSFYFEDFTDSMPAYIAEWKKLNLKFDGICSGFLGSHRQLKIVEDFFKTFKTDENIILVDPVMGDYGKLYSTYTTQTCTEMKKLVKYADILTPNLTEACILTDEEYDEKCPGRELFRIAKKLSDMGPSKIVITGIVRGKYIANYCYEKGRCRHPVILHRGILGHRERLCVSSPFVDRMLLLGQITLDGHQEFRLGCSLHKSRRLLVKLIHLHISLTDHNGTDQDLVSRITKIGEHKRRVLTCIRIL